MKETAINKSIDYSENIRKLENKYPYILRFAKSIYNVFHVRKIVGNEPTGPVVYLCRHMDKFGVVRAFADLKTVVRPWTLSCFCSVRGAKKQLSEYTYSKRKRKSRLFIMTVCPVIALILYRIIKLTKPISVYRGADASRSITTIKETVKALENNENVLIFPDVDYSNVDEKNANDEIYLGFFSVAKLYERRTGKKLPFVCIYLTKKETVINEPIYYENGKEFETRIKDGLYGRKTELQN